jgi:hypothetical protein
MMKENGTCKVLCTSKLEADDGKFINDRIREGYALNWLVDGLPAAEMKKDLKSGEIFFDNGFDLGYNEDGYTDRPSLNNHYDIFIRCVLTANPLQAVSTLKRLPGTTPRLQMSTELSAFWFGLQGKRMSDLHLSTRVTIVSCVLASVAIRISENVNFQRAHSSSAKRPTI